MENLAMPCCVNPLKSIDLMAELRQVVFLDKGNKKFHFVNVLNKIDICYK